MRLRRVVAVDVGGTGIKAARCDASTPDYRPVAELTRPTPVAAGVPAVVAAIADVITVLARAEPVDGVGVILPGAVEPAAGIARYSTNIGWRDLAIRDQLQQLTGLAVAIEHDVRAAGRAEFELGAAAGAADALFVALGTGIAAASRTGGHLVTGASYLAGELGHVPVRPDGERCPCGQVGCTEVYASAAAVARRYRQRTGTALPAEQVVAAAVAGQPAAMAVLAEAVQALSQALVFATLMLDPAVIVLGGGLAQAGPVLLEPVAAGLAQGLAWRPAPPVVPAAFGARAGQVGAALIGADAAARPPAR